MYCPEKMKLNKFVHVSIPKNSEFFSRMAGNMPVIPNGAYAGEDGIPMNMRKTEVLEHINSNELNSLRAEAAEARNKAQEEDSKDK